jgi:tripartite-type tricarboxylate transporter receptor subunit TctC
MKKYLLASLLAWFSVSASAQTIDFIVPDQPGRLTHDVEQLLTPHLVAAGYRVNTIIANNCHKGHRLFEQTNKPTLMIVYNGYISTAECGFTITDTTLISSLFQSPVVICSRPDIQDAIGVLRRRESVSLGLGGSDWPKPVVLALNPNFRIAVYNSSGDLARGFAAGDTDFIITNTVRASDLIKSERAKCLATTHTAEFQSIESAARVFENWQYNRDLTQIWAVAGHNITDQERQKIKGLIIDAMKTPAWKNLADRSGINIDHGIDNTTLYRTSKTWAIR